MVDYIVLSAFAYDKDFYMLCSFTPMPTYNVSVEFRKAIGFDARSGSVCGMYNCTT